MKRLYFYIAAFLPLVFIIGCKDGMLRMDPQNLRELMRQCQEHGNYPPRPMMKGVYSQSMENIDRSHPVKVKQGGHISGTVTGEGVPLEGVWVDVWDTVNFYVSSGCTDTLGDYLISDLPAGSYKLTTYNYHGYVDEWYNDKPDFWSADPVSVVPPDTTEDIDFDLALGGKISGTVTSAKGPLAYVMVDAYDASTFRWAGGAVTDTVGHYEITGLPTGDYKINATNTYGYVNEWYSDKPDFWSADPVSVTQPYTTEDINFILEFGSCISGMITNDTGGPLGGINVFAYDVTRPINPIGFVGVSTSDWSGYYIIQGLPSGSYKVRAWDIWGGGYVSEYWDDKTGWYTADIINVSKADTVENIDFSLSLGGKIKGTVYDANQMMPLPGELVIALNATTGEIVNIAQSSWEDGSYSLTGLPTDRFKVAVYPWLTMVHAFEFYDNKDGWATADIISVYAPDSVMGVDFYLEQGGCISGEVTGAKDSPIMGANIRVWVYVNPFYDWQALFTTITHYDGYYIHTGLRTGAYKVRADKSGYEVRWWDNEPDFSTADSVIVMMPDTTENINFLLPLIGVEERNEPFSYRLFQNSPNPVVNVTIIKYSIPEKTRVRLRIYNICGQLVCTLVDETKAAGSYSVQWDTRDARGVKVPAGVYFYRMDVGEMHYTRKLVVLY